MSDGKITEARLDAMTDIERFAREHGETSIENDVQPPHNRNHANRL